MSTTRIHSVSSKEDAFLLTNKLLRQAETRSEIGRQAETKYEIGKQAYIGEKEKNEGSGRKKSEKPKQVAYVRQQFPALQFNGGRLSLAAYRSKPEDKAIASAYGKYRSTVQFGRSIPFSLSHKLLNRLEPISAS